MRMTALMLHSINITIIRLLSSGPNGCHCNTIHLINAFQATGSYRSPICSARWREVSIVGICQCVSVASAVTGVLIAEECCRVPPA